MSRKGSVPWNRGKKIGPQTPEHTEKRKKAMLERGGPWNKGKKIGPQTPEHIEKIRQSMKGKNTGSRTPESNEKRRQSMLGKNTGSRTEEEKEEMRQIQLKYNREHPEKALEVGRSKREWWVNMSLEKYEEFCENVSKRMKKFCKENPEVGRRHSEYMTGKKASKETKRKQRIAAIKNIENRSGQCCPNYNPTGCKLIEEYGKENGYIFQHAENGGEFYIEELGYWVDGYDKEKNVIIEIDESFHYNFDDKLKIKDVERQEEIENFSGCKFIRLRI